MKNNENLSDEAIEAATDNLVKKVKSGKQFTYQIECANDETSSKAYASFRRKLKSNPNPTDIVVDFSKDRLLEIITDPKYKELIETGMKNAYGLCVAATLYDYSPRLGKTPDEVTAYIKEEGRYIPGDVGRFLWDMVDQKEGARILEIFDDFIPTIEYAESLGFSTTNLVSGIGRALLNDRTSDDKISVIGFERPQDETLKLLTETSQFGPSFRNQLAYLENHKIGEFIK